MEKNCIEYKVDSKIKKIDISGSPSFSYGKPEVLSGPNTDVTYGKSWYEQGFNIFPFLVPEEFEHLAGGISQCVEKILAGMSIDTKNFSLESYHKFVTNDDLHLQVAQKTRDLFPCDFNFDLDRYLKKFEEMVGFKLGSVNPVNGKEIHIIVRINRPHSSDYNPVHKDIYQSWDARSEISGFVNFWIPIAGVTEKSSLPVAPRSHLIPEDKILRTFDGGVVAGKKYRVRSVVSWGGDNSLIRTAVENGQVLIFSSHLIHGLGINEQDDKTRVALEFRLFKQKKQD